MMFDTLLTKIAGFFEKDFLFASFLPALLFIAALVISLAGVLSIEAVWAWVDTWTAMQKAAAAVAGVLFVVVVAYVLQALRTSFTRGWTGNSNSWMLWGFINLGVLFQKWRYRRRLAASRRLSPWQALLDNFDSDLRGVWGRDGRSLLPDAHKVALLYAINSLRVGMPEAAIKEQLDEVLGAFRVYSGDDLMDVYKAIKMKISEWNDDEQARIQSDTYNLDRWYGRLQSVRPTKLGNVIEAYNYYPFKRYQIEPNIFWPRLRKVITPEYLSHVQESRILLDFLLAMATLAGVYAFLALTVGPWLWFNLRLWRFLAVVALIVSYFFYRLSIRTAFELGEMVRSCFDLFRLDLMTALQRPRPSTLAAEQAQWEELSNLAVYGFSKNFNLAENPAPITPQPPST
jgi:hypothetical protein